ncbi:uncharacterized protein [Euphorbia lathyris]|uniref:uncharacterized protein n=1 Tax=Euphorbia lathyris TaxID=212925 RepID=UPI003313ED86
MAQQITEELKAKSEVYHGDEICKEKSMELLREVDLPNGLLPLHDIIECGYHRESGFVWLKQKKSITHKFDKIGKLVTYGTEVTAVVEKHKIKKLTGVKTKELLVWVSLSDIYVDENSKDKITFQTPTMLYRTFPVSAFMVEEKLGDGKDLKEEKKDVTPALEVKEV